VTDRVRDARPRLRPRDVRRPWGRLRVWDGGVGATLLAVHGMGGSGRYWRRLAERAGDRIRVVAPDLAGFGGSAKPRSERYDLPFHLANLDAALEGVRGDVVVTGHSIGGAIAAFWAAERVGRVRGVALLAAPYPAGDGEHAWMREGNPPPGSRAVMRAFRVLVPLLSLPVGVARRYPPGVALDYGRQGFVGRARTTWWVLHDPGVRPALERAAASLANVPVLLANTPDDRTVPLSSQDRWAEALPHAERVVVGDGGHQFPLRTAEPLLAWLDTLG
jgi:pimeloyl-ACP methyl ester carboxylesterase